MEVLPCLLYLLYGVFGWLYLAYNLGHEPISKEHHIAITHVADMRWPSLQRRLQSP